MFALYCVILKKSELGSVTSILLGKLISRFEKPRGDRTRPFSTRCLREIRAIQSVNSRLTLRRDRWHPIYFLLSRPRFLTALNIKGEAGPTVDDNLSRSQFKPNQHWRWRGNVWRFRDSVGGNRKAAATLQPAFSLLRLLPLRRRSRSSSRDFILYFHSC